MYSNNGGARIGLQKPESSIENIVIEFVRYESHNYGVSLTILHFRIILMEFSLYAVFCDEERLQASLLNFVDGYGHRGQDFRHVHFES